MKKVEQRKAARPVRAGLFGIGLDAYWPQFPGLKRRLEGYLSVVENRLRRPGVELVNLGLIDTPARALEAGHRFRREDVDLIFSTRDNLRALVHGPARGATGQGAGDRAQPAAGGGD